MAINKKGRFCAAVPECPGPDTSFRDVMRLLDESEKAVNPEVKTGALNNAHGDWYEWLLAIAAWNWNVAHPQSHWLVQLPNVTRFDVASLYSARLHEMINDLRAKVFNVAGVSLITSNPDFAIINHSNIELAEGFPSTPILNIDEAAITEIENFHKSVIGRCTFEGIEGYLSAKFSLRPDRRLQLPHEGSLMKALYAHIQTREWVIDPPGLKYYGCSAKVSKTDHDALQTVATHSITTVFTMPQKAVDNLFEIDSIQAADQMFAVILGS